MVRRILIAAAFMAALALPSAALGKTVTARGHGVTARYSFSGTFPRYRDETLTISRAGTVVYHGAVTASACGHECDPSLTPAQPPVQVVALASGAPPTVLLNLYSGGAHCCSVLEVFNPSAALGGYVEVAQHDFGDPGYRLEDLLHNGTEDFVTANDAFAYEFTDFAASGLPIEILQFNGTMFENVTNAFPGLVRTDAARWLSAYRQMARSGYADSVGVIAAWAADEYTLGRAAPALSYLDRQASDGHLKSPLFNHESGRAFVAKLRGFLRRQGYAFSSPGG